MYGAYTAGLRSLPLWYRRKLSLEQHYQSLAGAFPGARGSALNFWDEGGQKKVALSKIESGEAQMIVGTHSLIQDAVTCLPRLGLK